MTDANHRDRLTTRLYADAMRYRLKPELNWRTHWKYPPDVGPTIFPHRSYHSWHPMFQDCPAVQSDCSNPLGHTIFPKIPMESNVMHTQRLHPLTKQCSEILNDLFLLQSTTHTQQGRGITPDSPNRDSWMHVIMIHTQNDQIHSCHAHIYKIHHAFII